MYADEPRRFGGRLDTKTGRFVDECEHWRVWLVGELAAQILFRADAARPQTLLYSAEGWGKTVLMAQWIWLQVMAAIAIGKPGTVGATAPTGKRLSSLVKSVCDVGRVSSSQRKVPFAWGHHYVEAGEIHTPTGHIVQFCSTKKQSGETGSPVQGYTWRLGAAVDEAQDTVEQGAYPDIVSRLRGGNRAPIMATATAKDSSAWRNWRDSLSKNWNVERLPFNTAWSVPPADWDRLKAECTPREWQRRGLAEDVGPERMVYTTWERSENLRHLPQIGGPIDVTDEILRPWGGGEYLIGHDPGQIHDVSLLLKAYRAKGEAKHSWWVVDELTTNGTTTEEHVVELVKLLKTKSLDGKDLPHVHARLDPFGESDNKTDKSVHQTFREHGIEARSAAYKHGKGSGRVPKNAGIEMVCRLFCDAFGARRLFIATDERGSPVAPRLVHAIELSERDAEGKAETQRKGKDDLSHWPAALRYALYPFERKIEVAA